MSSNVEITLFRPSKIEITSQRSRLYCFLQHVSVTPLTSRIVDRSSRQIADLYLLSQK
jgi:hypothetical protein